MNAAADVVVVGAGLSGLTAALTAVEAGARSVLVLEAASKAGGAAALSMGIFVGAGSGAQLRAGIEDSSDLMFRDYMAVNQWGLIGGLTRVIAEESGVAIDWLETQGVEFRSELVKAPADSRARGAHAVGNGKAVIDALVAAIATNEAIKVLYGKRADRLITEGETVTGVGVGDEMYLAPAVILASGGFGASPEKRSALFASATKADDWTLYVGPETNRGDALDLAGPLGAGLTGLDTGCMMMTPGFSPERETYLPGWLVVVDPAGRRFVAEDSHYSVLDRQAYLHGGRFFAILDSQALDDEIARLTPSYAGSARAYQGQPERTSPSWNAATLRGMAAQGRMLQAETLEELGNLIGAAPGQLRATIDTYNTGAREGRDLMAKASQFLRPLDRGPFYAAEMRHAQIIITGAGLQIDQDAHVVDSVGRAIPGLFAAGEVTGGLVWPFYPSSGSALGHALAFGRVAGRSAVDPSSRS